MIELREALKEGISNDEAKYLIPEAYKTSLVMTINARSLQNFLELRSSKHALWEIRDLAKNIYEAIPEEHKYLFEECMNEQSI
jgi:thymidylate synthase (FAD)